MVLGWRRAFCTSIPKDTDSDEPAKTPRPTSKFTFFSTPSTPRAALTCRTSAAAAATLNSPKLHCRATSESPRLYGNASSESPRLYGNVSSPMTPSSFSLLKSTLRLSTKRRSRCGVCSETVRSGQGTAIFAAECSHQFHFPCIAGHVEARQVLVCPVCDVVWKEFPELSVVGEKQKPIPELREVKTKPLRVYDDDEPLMSPTTGSRFNPIPELNENDDDDGENGFQGFFINPTFSPELSSRSELAGVEVNLSPEAAVLAVGRGYETCSVMMRVKALPAGVSFRRSPVDMVTVLEVTGAMTGNKLNTLKRAMSLIISSLSESDRLSIVAFSAASKRLLPLRRMTASGRRSARRIVDSLGSTGQGMCVGDALKKAAKVLEDRRQKNSVATIILLSDGQDTPGPTITSTRFSHSNIPVHALKITDTGACSNAPFDDSLTKSLESLLTVVVQDLTLQLRLISGPVQAKIGAIYSLTGKPVVHSSGLVQLGDLFAEEERELLIELKVPISSSGSRQFLTVRSSYKDPSSGVDVHTKEQTLTVPRPQAVRSSSPTIQRLMNLHVTVRAIAESRRLMDHNDFSGAHHLLSSGRALLMKPSSGSAEEFLRGLEAEQAELSRRRLQRETSRAEEKAEPLTPTSAWRAAERLAKVAVMRKSMNRVSDLHGFENARF